MVVLKRYLFIDDEMNTLSARKDVMLERYGPVIRVNDVTGLLVQVANPFGKLPRIWNSGREEDKVNIIRQKNAINKV